MYIVLDTETGGLTTDYSLLSVAGIILDDNLDVKEDFHFLVAPLHKDDYSCTEEALQVNGIDLGWHYDNAYTYQSGQFQIGCVLAQYATQYIPIGWNVDFDISFIRAYLPVVARSLHYRKLDVNSVARFMNIKYGTNMGSLVNWAEYFKLDASKAHDALVDCYLTLGVLKGFLNYE